MWIKSEQGVIYKLDAITSVRVVATADEDAESCQVSATIGGNQVDLTLPNKTQEEANAILDRIMNHLIGNLDLSGEPAPHHHIDQR